MPMPTVYDQLDILRETTSDLYTQHFEEWGITTDTLTGPLVFMHSTLYGAYHFHIAKHSDETTKRLYADQWFDGINQLALSMNLTGQQHDHLDKRT